MFDAQKLWSSSQLPSLPSVAVRLLELARTPDAELREVISTIKTDPAISAKLIKAANSSFFGLPNRVTSVERAVPLLGTTAVTSLALSFSLTDAAMTSGPLADHYADYWQQSIVQAAAAELLSHSIAEAVESDYFLAGLLTGIGRLALLKTVPRDYCPVLEAARDSQRPLHAVETEMLGIDHAAIGAKLLRNWNLPEPLVASIDRQYASIEVLRSLKSEPNFEMTFVLAIAVSMGAYFCTPNKGTAIQRLRDLTSEFLQWTEKELNASLEAIRSRVDEAADLMAIKIDHLAEPAELMAAANEQLAHLATQAVVMQRKIEREKEELEAEKRELESQALCDPLTGAYNRRFFEDELNREVSKAARYAKTVGLIFMDIDRFKQLNDNYGHQFGDLVLKRVAIALRETLRESDSLCRYGGEEFVIVVSETTEKGIQRFAERLRARVENETIALGDEIIPVTISVGAAVCMPRRGEKDVAMRLTAAADGAMYDSKQGGRNQVHFRSLISEPDRHLMQRVGQRRFSRWLVNRQVFDVPTASRALLEVSPAAAKIGELAIREKILDAAQVQTVLDEQQRTGMRFGETAIQLGLLREEQLVCLLAQQEEEPEQLCAAIRKHRLLEETTLQTLFAEYLAERQQWLLAEVGV